MSAPSTAGALIYAKDLEQITEFYAKLLSMDVCYREQDHNVLDSQDFQLILHAIPDEIAKSIHIASPPEPRDSTPIKLFFTVDDLSRARATAAKLGGEIYHEQWAGPGFVVCNACDPEGNIFQLRENTAT